MADGMHDAAGSVLLREKEDDSWYIPIDEFVTQHQQMMQSQPDSMILQIRNLKCGGKPELVEQWKRLIVAKCCYLKGADLNLWEKIS